MSNRRNHTRAQRLWRHWRKKTTAEIMLGTNIYNRHGEQMFFWRPDEIRTTIVRISTHCRPPRLYCLFEDTRP